jgi:hypothetical protein
MIKTLILETCNFQNEVPSVNYHNVWTPEFIPSPPHGLSFQRAQISPLTNMHHLLVKALPWTWRRNWTPPMLPEWFTFKSLPITNGHLHISLLQSHDLWMDVCTHTHTDMHCPPECGADYNPQQKVLLLMNSYLPYPTLHSVSESHA